MTGLHGKLKNRVSMAFKNLRLGSDTSRLILLFVAILPDTESNDWLFYTVSVLIIGLFIIHVIYGIKQLYRQEKYFLCIMGNLRSELIDLMVEIAGLMVAYSMDYTGYIRFWWFMIAITLVGILLQLKLENQKKG